MAAMILIIRGSHGRISPVAVLFLLAAPCCEFPHLTCSTPPATSSADGRLLVVENLKYSQELGDRQKLPDLGGQIQEF
jgi:hypothetical protein